MHEVCKMCKKNKHRSCEEKKNIIKRLNVIEGQIRGIKQWWKMIDIVVK